MTESSKNFIEEAKQNAKFDIDFDFCQRVAFKLSDKKHSTDGINLFDSKIGLKFFNKDDKN